MSDPCLPLSKHQAVVAAPLTVEGTVSVQVALATLARAQAAALAPETAQDWRHALRTRCLVVVDGDQRVRGLLTAMDGLCLLTQDPPLALPLEQCPVEQVMTPATMLWRESALPDWPEIVIALGAGQPIPVVDDQDRLVGLVGAESVAAMAVAEVQAASESPRVSVLQDRETRYQALMDRASDAIMIADLEGNILEVNRQAEKLLGYTTAELATMHFTQLHPPEDMPRIRSAFEQLANQQVCQVLDVNFRRRDGQVVPVDISASVISLPDRPIIQGLFRDIRERKAMEQALRQSEAQYRQIVDTASEGIWVIDAEGRTLMGNLALAQSLGVDHGALVGQSLFQFVDQADHPTLEAHLQHHRQGQSDHYELPLRRSDGTQRVMLASVSPMVDQEVTCTGMTLMLTDITDRKRMETSLAAKTEELDGFFSVAIDLLCIASLDGRFVRLNQQWEQVLGYPLADLEGREFLTFVHPDDLENTLQEINRLDRGGITMNFVNRYRCRDGQYRWIEWRSAPQGNFIYSAARDITDRVLSEQRERRRAEQEQVLREITQRIRQSLELQTIFDTACPEIRQVLAADRVGIFRFDDNGSAQTGQFVAESVSLGLPSILAVPVPDYRQRSVYHPLYQGDAFVAIPDLLPLDADEHSVLLGFQVRASLVVPLISGDQLWGLLCIHQCDGPRQWSEADVALAQHLANQLAIAIYQASLFGQIQRELAERQQAQQQLSERNQQLAISNQELARATRLKDEFLATMSHELRTPLNAVLGMTEGMQDLTFGPITPEQQHALQIIERSGNHLLELIRGYLKTRRRGMKRFTQVSVA
ncbi:MAG: PAS domain S-box protein [Leptolyngbya sp.]|nr:PAS domain S-box protein [Leptolyngbya sp.]